MSSRQSATEIETEAARWVIRLDRDGRSDGTQADLDAWLAGDTRRVGALLQAEAAWSTLDRARLQPTPARRPAWTFPSRRMLGAGVAAAIAASIAGAVWIGMPARYDTTVGEIRRVPLADGSTAAINTASTIAVDLGDDLRRVRVERGEAWFQVARDPNRPFRVEAGLVRIQAIGTAFSVRRLPDGVQVMVSEGTVKVWVDGAQTETVQLKAGSRAFVSDQAVVRDSVGAPSEIDRELAWRSGKIDLAGESLAHAVAEFNRYNSRTLVIADPALADERLYGVFRIDDPAGFANTVAYSLQTTVKAGDAAITIGEGGG